MPVVSDGIEFVNVFDVNEFVLVSEVACKEFDSVCISIFDLVDGNVLILFFVDCVVDVSIIVDAVVDVSIIVDEVVVIGLKGINNDLIC